MSERDIVIIALLVLFTLYFIYIQVSAEINYRRMKKRNEAMRRRVEEKLGIRER